MNHSKALSTFIFLALCFYANSFFAQQENRQFYQLKTYTFSTDEQESRTDDFLKNAYLPALKRQNIKPIGVFKPQSYAPKDSLKRRIVLIPFASLDAFEELEGQLQKDKRFQEAGDAYINTPQDRPAYVRMQSILLKAFEDMPQLEASPLDGSREDRIYELRSYQSASVADHLNKVEMFNEGGEVALFDRLEFNAVFYASVLSGPEMPNLMYMVTFKDEASRNEHWEKFSKDPEWQKLSKEPKYQDNVSHIDNWFLTPTEYSDY